MLPTSDRPTQPGKAATFDRRAAFRLAFVALPVMAAFAVPSINSAAASETPTIDIIDAVSRTVDDRTSLVPGTYKPDTSTTGVPDGTVLAQVNGDIVVTAPNTLIDAREVFGFIRVNANNTHVTRTRVHGRGTGFVQSALILIAPGVTGTVIEDCEIACDNPQYWQNGIAGSDFTARRCDMHDTIDAFDVDAGNVLIESCYIHELTFRSDDKDHANDKFHPYWTHNDGVQIKGGTNTTIRGCNFSTYVSLQSGTTPTDRLHDLQSGWNNYGASITCSPDKGEITGLLVELNWFDGGDTNFQDNYSPSAAFTLGTMRYNRFGNDQHVYPGTKDSRYQIRFAAGITIDGLQTNYWDPKSATVPAANRGKPFSMGYQNGVRSP